MPEITHWETGLETKLYGNPNDYQASKDLWLSRLRDAFSAYGFSINTDELISNNLFVIDIINESTQQIRVVFAHPNYIGNERSTSQANLWNSMITRMTRYLCQVRNQRMAYREVTNSQIVDDGTYYTIIAVGRYIRFFALEADSNDLMDCSGTNEGLYDVFQEKDQIRALFWEISRNNSEL